MGGPYNKDHSALGPVLGSPYFGNIGIWVRQKYPFPPLFWGLLIKAEY